MVLAALWLYPGDATAREWPRSAMATAYAERTKTAYQPAGGVNVVRTSVDGTDTILEIEQTAARLPRHDVDMGRTRFVLRSRQSKAVVFDETFTELWDCIGFNPRSRRYVLTSKNEHGVKVTLRGLVYVDEGAGAFVDSVFGTVGFHAVSSLFQPEGGYLALVGWKDADPARKQAVRLYALDTTADVLVPLGAPPAPPPLPQDGTAYVDQPWMVFPWDAPERHYTELEPRVWRFTGPATLEVSYGKDTLRKRSARRTPKRFEIDRLAVRKKI